MESNTQNQEDLSNWDNLKHRYNLIELMGQGSFGTVMKAQDLFTGQLVAIKYLNKIFDSTYHARSALREIILLRKLTEIENNIYTPKLLDIILPEGVLAPYISSKEESKKS